MTVTRVFLYEFVTGGGCWSLENSQLPSGTLLAEGKAMLQSVAQDLLALDKFEIHLLADSRLAPFWADACCVHAVNARADEQRLIQRLAKSCDLSLVIAPEFDGLLESRTEWVADVGTLSSPDAEFVALAASKPRLADHLRAAGLPVPRSTTLLDNQPPPHNFPFPAVLKPIDGAGSVDVHRVSSLSALTACRSTRPAWQLEAFHAGIPASVAMLSGPNQQLVLPPGQQLLSSDGRFRYSGSTWPLAHGHQERATRLATAVALAMPATRGYFGIDLVLGTASDGSEDVVIEVNPRLTTSYVGLRRMAKSNLAAAMLRVAQGLPTSALAWHDWPVTWQLGETLLGADA